MLKNGSLRTAAMVICWISAGAALLWHSVLQYIQPMMGRATLQHAGAGAAGCQKTAAVAMQSRGGEQSAYQSPNEKRTLMSMGLMSGAAAVGMYMGSKKVPGRWNDPMRQSQPPNTHKPNATQNQVKAYSSALQGGGDINAWSPNQPSLAMRDTNTHMLCNVGKLAAACKVSKWSPNKDEAYCHGTQYYNGDVCHQPSAKAGTNPFKAIWKRNVPQPRWEREPMMDKIYLGKVYTVPATGRHTSLVLGRLYEAQDTNGNFWLVRAETRNHDASYTCCLIDDKGVFGEPVYWEKVWPANCFDTDKTLQQPATNREGEWSPTEWPLQQPATNREKEWSPNSVPEHLIAVPLADRGRARSMASGGAGGATPWTGMGSSFDQGSWSMPAGRAGPAPVILTATG